MIYNYGVLTPIEEENGLKYAIDISRKAAWSNINRFDIDIVDKMNDLSRGINNKEEKTDAGVVHIKKALYHN